MFCVAQQSYLARYGSFSRENSNKLSVGPPIVLLLAGLIPSDGNLQGNVCLTQFENCSHINCARVTELSSSTIKTELNIEN